MYWYLLLLTGHSSPHLILWYPLQAWLPVQTGMSAGGHSSPHQIVWYSLQVIDMRLVLDIPFDVFPGQV